MVGVSRSQGCRSCKQKKKGCDLARPSCGLCLRLGRVCGYDDKKWTFVNSAESSFPPSPSSPLTSASSTCSSSSSPSSSSSSSSCSWSSTTSVNISSRHPSPSPPKPARLHNANTVPLSIGRSLASKALAVQLEESFWAAYLPRDDFLNCTYIGGVTDTPWIPAVRHIAAHDALTRSALDCLVLTALGNIFEDHVLLHEGTKAHAKVLQATLVAIKDPLREQCDGVVATCELLGACEIFRKDEAKQGLDWKGHVFGACQLVHARGPQQHTGRTSHALFLQARNVAITAGLYNKTPISLFETSEWRTIPWKNTSRTIRDELWDIMSMIPALYQQQDSLFRKLHTYPTGLDAHDLINRGRIVLENSIYIATFLLLLATAAAL